MDKLKLHTPDFIEANIAKLAELFPNCVTEVKDEGGRMSGKDEGGRLKDDNGRHSSSFSLPNSSLKHAIDFDLLRQELSGHVVEGQQERYQLNWPGKREALLTANAPIAKTLRPCREESVDFDTTQNLYIEGDNLDALKLLQETYLGKVKMIYIDPPYNTGNDFIYEDDFAEDSESYMLRSNQKDEAGNRLVANNESNGRFHSDWLSMMYPRLKLARNLLRDDGVVFISIDDNEVRGVSALCDEIFGEANFIAEIVWEKMYTTKNDASLVSVSHEYVVCYAKSNVSTAIGLLPRTAEMNARYSNPDNDPRGPWKAIPMYADGERKNGRFKITSPTGKQHEPQTNAHWRYAEKDVLSLMADNRISFGRTGDSQPNLKRFLSEVRDGVKVKSLWFHKEVGSNDTASREVKELFNLNRTPMSFPKPTTLLRRMLQLAAYQHDSIVLDFFSGSSSTAHAVMQMNAEDGGIRKFIMVQVPEICDENSEALTAGYKTIAEIGKERIRRAGQKIKDEGGRMKDEIKPDNSSFIPHPSSLALDIGFRVLKIDSSNMKDVYYAPDQLQQTHLDQFTDNIKDDRTAEDLLFQVLLDWGVDLTLPITQETIVVKDEGGRMKDEIAADNSSFIPHPSSFQVFFVDHNALAACFDSNINEAFVKELAKRHPLRVVFRDAGFASDSVKINIEQIFKMLSPSTEIKTL